VRPAAASGWKHSVRLGHEASLGGMAAPPRQNGAYQYMTLISTSVAAPDKEGPTIFVGEPGRPDEVM
jgi:hypothetical protein